jgi:hypothetical protein
MKLTPPSLALFSALIGLAFSTAGCAQNARPQPVVVVADNPAFAPVAEKRVTGIMSALKLADAEQAARVKQHILNFMVTTKNAYEGKQPLTGDALREALVQARTAFYAALDSEQLTEDQLIVIKNGLAGGHFNREYNAVQELIPTLTEEEKAYIREQLKSGFDDAIILNDGEAKGAVFHKIRGRNNNYLAKRGYDLKKLSQELKERNQNKRANSAKP